MQHFSRNWTISAGNSFLVLIGLVYFFMSSPNSPAVAKLGSIFSFISVILLLRPPRFGPGRGERMRIFFIIIKQRLPRTVSKTSRKSEWKTETVVGERATWAFLIAQLQQLLLGLQTHLACKVNVLLLSVQSLTMDFISRSMTALKLLEH